MKEETWANIEGQVRHGTVKSITDFGAFMTWVEWPVACF